MVKVRVLDSSESTVGTRHANRRAGAGAAAAAHRHRGAQDRGHRGARHPRTPSGGTWRGFLAVPRLHPRRARQPDRLATLRPRTTATMCASASGRPPTPCGCGSIARPPWLRLGARAVLEDRAGAGARPRAGGRAGARRRTRRADGPHPPAGDARHRRPSRRGAGGRQEAGRPAGAASAAAADRGGADRRFPDAGRAGARDDRAALRAWARGHVVLVVDPVEETFPSRGRRCWPTSRGRRRCASATPARSATSIWSACARTAPRWPRLARAGRGASPCTAPTARI